MIASCSTLARELRSTIARTDDIVGGPCACSCIDAGERECRVVERPRIRRTRQLQVPRDQAVSGRPTYLPTSPAPASLSV